VRAFLEYESVQDSTWRTGRIEIPQTAIEPDPPRYPVPLSRELTAVVFHPSGYSFAVAQLRSRYPPGTFRLLRILYVLTQIDEACYAYYSTVNGFPDEGTLRLDEPDFTNIEGGFGVFTMTSETVVAADTMRN
jgi:hypothetical protein